MYYRKPCGKGFTFQTARGKTIAAGPLREWLKSLVIPPAWREVEISQDKDSDLWATGRDEAGRKQYIYNPAYRQKREQEKFERIVRFAESLETMRRATGQHLRHDTFTREKVLACMVRLLDQAYFRPGNPHYTKENDSYGLTTLRSRHLTVEGDEIIFKYQGKSGVEQERHVIDKTLAQVVSELDEIPGYRIFKYFDESGEKHVVEGKELNEYIKEVMGEDFSAKDFRTWAGTYIAALALDELGVSDEPDKVDKNVKEAVERVAQMLGNTATVALASYIAPKVIESYRNGKTTRFFLSQIKRKLRKPEELSLEELGILYLLKDGLTR